MPPAIVKCYFPNKAHLWIQINSGRCALVHGKKRHGQKLKKPWNGRKKKQTSTDKYFRHENVWLFPLQQSCKKPKKIRSPSTWFYIILSLKRYYTMLSWIDWGCRQHKKCKYGIFISFCYYYSEQSVISAIVCGYKLGLRVKLFLPWTLDTEPKKNSLHTFHSLNLFRLV